MVCKWINIILFLLMNFHCSTAERENGQKESTTDNSSTSGSNTNADSNTIKDSNKTDFDNSNNKKQNTNPTNSSNLLLMTDFESNTIAAEFSTAGKTSITDSIAAHGKYSLRIDAGAGYNDAGFLITDKIFPLKNPVLHIRFYIYLQDKIPESHVTYALVSSGMINKPETEIRLSGQFGILEWNYFGYNNPKGNDAIRISGDNKTFNTKIGIRLEAKKWYCVEYYIDSKAQALGLYVDSQENSNMKLDKPSDWSQNPGDKWLPTLSFMKIGYQAYGGGPATAVYIDDVAFSASKIGCL